MRHSTDEFDAENLASIGDFSNTASKLLNSSSIIAKPFGG
jgi:hypothetical protein